jgi:hypothetical protein
MEVYYERLLKLINTFQHMTKCSFLNIVFKSRLLPYPLFLSFILHNTCIFYLTMVTDIKLVDV